MLKRPWGGILLGIVGILLIVSIPAAMLGFIPFIRWATGHPSDTRLLTRFQQHRVELNRLIKMFETDTEFGRVGEDSHFGPMTHRRSAFPLTHPGVSPSLCVRRCPCLHRRLQPRRVRERDAREEPDLDTRLERGPIDRWLVKRIFVLQVASVRSRLRPRSRVAERGAEMPDLDSIHRGSVVPLLRRHKLIVVRSRHEPFAGSRGLLDCIGERSSCGRATVPLHRSAACRRADVFNALRRDRLRDELGQGLPDPLRGP